MSQPDNYFQCVKNVNLIHLATGNQPLHIARTVTEPERFTQMAINTYQRRTETMKQPDTYDVTSPNGAIVLGNLEREDAILMALAGEEGTKISDKGGKDVTADFLSTDEIPGKVVIDLESRNTLVIPKGESVIIRRWIKLKGD